MKRRLVDAGPLLFLARLGRLDLLLLDAEKVLVPVAVLAEIRVEPDCAAVAVEAALGKWLEECRVGASAFLRLLPDLGKGERELIVQALEQGITSVVLDDLAARRFARRLGLEPVGTVGLLLAGKKRGLVSTLRSELDRLQAMGFWISTRLREDVLKEAGEEDINS